jgi:4-aminobutyrate aminotransferase-like enzyme
MSGVELDDATRSRRVIEACKAAGLIVESNLMNEATIRLSPPLVLTDEENAQGMAILESCLAAEV